jgi:hypothetical protein
MKTSYKIVGALLILAVAAFHVLVYGLRDWSSDNTPYVGGLLLLFFWRETIDDERVKSLKLRALTVAVVIGYGVSVAARIAVMVQKRTDLPKSISAFDFLFVVIFTAFVLFHYWRWQDGRASKPE